MLPNDPKQIWQNQPREMSGKTLEKMIQRRARELNAKTRGELITMVALLLLTVAFSVFGIVKAHGPIQRIAFAATIVWALASLYAVNRGMWSRMLPGDAGVTTGLQFYRRELAQRRSLLGRSWGWTLGPLLLPIATFFAPLVSREQLPKILPFVSLLVVWIVAFFLIRVHTRKGLQCEIDELDEIEKENF
jgi:type II secretory pathway component PulM